MSNAGLTKLIQLSGFQSLKNIVFTVDTVGTVDTP